MNLTRCQLYEQVWREPMVKLARSFGLSDVGLAKTCRKHDIPVPPRGYWAKKQSGKAPAQIPLPAPGRDFAIELRDPPSTAESYRTYATAASQGLEDERIHVADTLRGAHELVSAAKQELDAARVGEHGLLDQPKNIPLAIHVSRGSLRRAFLIMDAILKALERRDYPVAAGPSVTILGATIRFCISEQLDVQETEPKDHELEGRYSFGHSRFIKKQVPSGRLTLKIDHGESYWSPGCRQTWRDTQKRKLEDMLNGIVAGLVELGARMKARDDEREARARERRREEQRREEAARVRAEKLALIKAERARVKDLLAMADDWRRSQRVREFVEAVEGAHKASGSGIEPESEIGRWISWARQQADRLDPLVESPPSMLDEDVDE